MKQIPLILSLFLVTVLAACGKLELPGDEPDGKPQTEEPDGGGEDADYGEVITVRQAIAAPEGTYVCIRGYIVGYKANSKNIFDVPDDGSNANFLLADSPGERDNSAIIAVSLGAKGSFFREELNLYDFPEYLYRRIRVEGMLEKYYYKNGIKELLDYEWDDTEGGDDYTDDGKDDSGTGTGDGGNGDGTEKRPPGIDESVQTVAEGR
ncbi:MAG: hypothetical protein IJ722_06820 [Alloprevotella sp.]|nr:hypothetical protein [Alloprevotella sp.]